ncbi:MAG TPA: alpha/beta hydrolase [Mycobacteriales bacterium]|nr:alpha/beta hydrolase [Mycobacteriales bacterium]
MSPSPRPLRREAVGLLLVLVLSACSGGGSKPQSGPSPTTSPTAGATASAGASATPTPTPARGTARAFPRPGRLSGWTGCGGGFQCATLTVPLDEARPALGTVGLAVTRHRATGSHRIGSLITNPGGPGESAVSWLHRSYESFPSAVRSRFDLVTFDPRGVGRTASVRCLSTRELDAYFHIDPAPDDAQERKALLAGVRTFDAGCARRSGRVLPYVNTQVVAQDLDRVRQAVGDAQLTYLGYSYGTAIGAAYLDQFPTRVRAMVLDGALDPRLTWDGFLRGQSGGFDLALRSFLDSCQRTGCAFRRATVGDLRQAFDRLAARVDAHALPGDGSRTVGPDEFTLGVGAGLYSRNYGWPAIAEALADAQDGDGRRLLALSDGYVERHDDGYSNLNEANVAVNCVDRPWPRTEKPYYDLAAQVARTAPRFGPAIALSGLACIAWGTPSTGRPHTVTGAGSPPIVVIGTTRDPATPYAWAQALAGQLSRGVLLTHVGDGHTVYRMGAPRCIAQPVDNYLISLRVPPTSRC